MNWHSQGQAVGVRPCGYEGHYWCRLLPYTGIHVVSAARSSSPAADDAVLLLSKAAEPSKTGDASNCLLLNLNFSSSCCCFVQLQVMCLRRHDLVHLSGVFPCKLRCSPDTCICEVFYFQRGNPVYIGYSNWCAFWTEATTAGLAKCISSQSHSLLYRCRQSRPTSYVKYCHCAKFTNTGGCSGGRDPKRHVKNPWSCYVFVMF